MTRPSTPATLGVKNSSLIFLIQWLCCDFLCVGVFASIVFFPFSHDSTLAQAGGLAKPRLFEDAAPEGDGLDFLTDVPHVADEPEYSARSHVRQEVSKHTVRVFTYSLSAADVILRRSLTASVSASTIIHCFVFNTEEQARRQSASQSAVSETAIGASTTSVTKLERPTRMSGMKRMHAGITFEALFGTSLKFGLCHLSNTCCSFLFRADQSQPSRFLQLRNARWR